MEAVDGDCHLDYFLLFMENVIENSVHLHGQNQPTVHVDGLPGGYGYRYWREVHFLEGIV